MRDDRAQKLQMFRWEFYNDLHDAIYEIMESYQILQEKTLALKKQTDWSHVTYTDETGTKRPVLWDDATPEDIEYLEEVIRHDEQMNIIYDVLTKLEEVMPKP